MEKHVALCTDEPTCRNPQIIGLDGEILTSQDWLEVFVDGEDARRRIGDGGSWNEAWVTASDNIEPINLAATIKADNPGLNVVLVDDTSNGSLLSRAHNAQIDEVIDLATLAERYGHAKERFSKQAGVDAEPAQASPYVQGPFFRDDTRASAQIAPPTDLALLARPAPIVLGTTRGRGFLMPVVSGSGGAGKSSVSTLAAYLASEMGYRTLLLDYDLQFGDIARMAGIEDPVTIDVALAQPETLERESNLGTPVAVLAAPRHLEQAERVVHGVEGILDWATSTFDVVIANTGSAWADQHAVLLERSHVTLFLVDQRASSIHACKHALDLCIRCGIATGPFEFALNRCAKGAPLTPNDVSSALQGAPVFELRDGGRDVEDYLGAGAALDLLRTDNDFCESLRQVVSRLLPTDAGERTEAPPKAEGKGLIRRRGRHASRKRGRKS